MRMNVTPNLHNFYTKRNEEVSIDVQSKLDERKEKSNGDMVEAKERELVDDETPWLT